ncbi:MAG: polysaccharide lyase family 7 protein [Verrucomicrobia bacterium]|nr:polysaccharide lyase family 7 protein [Verrucomicrobiota bacterium]MCH8528642.1 polysaccharide lyase family 7 protein [Kiritimatiellia bacterium]
MNPLKYISAFRHSGKVAAATTMMIALACGAYGQSEPKVPFDLEKFQSVLSESRLHSPRTRNPIAVRTGQFDGYELPGRFYLGENGTTMVLATTRSDRDRSELRHRTWPVTEGEIHYSARLRLDALVPEGEGWKRRRLNFVQIYVPGIPLGPVVLISGRVLWDDKEDHLWVSVQRGGEYDLGPRPDGFFDLDVRVKDGVLRVYMNNELKAEDNLSSFEGRRAFFKTGAYHRGIEPHVVEFERLTITTP